SLITLLEQTARLACGQGRRRDHVHDHHRVVMTIEQQRGIAGPHRLVAAVRRDGPFLARSLERSHVDLVTPRLVRYVRNPATVRRKRWRTFPEFRAQESARLARFATIDDTDVLSRRL